MASRVGISRGTLRAIEAGDPTPSMGTYLKVPSALGIAGDLALLADGVTRPATSNTTAAGTSRDAPLARIVVSVDTTRHRIQDLRSLALHEEAVRRVRADPALIQQAQAVLQKWLGAGDQRSASLWVEWKDILEHRKWRKCSQGLGTHPVHNVVPNGVTCGWLGRRASAPIRLGQSQPRTKRRLQATMTQIDIDAYAIPKA